MHEHANPYVILMSLYFKFASRWVGVDAFVELDLLAMSENLHCTLSCLPLSSYISTYCSSQQAATASFRMSEARRRLHAGALCCSRHCSPRYLRASIPPLSALPRALLRSLKVPYHQQIMRCVRTITGVSIPLHLQTFLEGPCHAMPPRFEQ
jgi:hypothetical protein